jgi:ribosomal protein RSM22 (predicted rRNA methylase)
LPDFPPSLAAGIDTLVAGHELRSLEGAAAQLSDAYRGSTRTASRAARTDVDVAAYLAARAPATYSASVAALEQVRLQRPDWSPQSVLDIGAGPGVTSWAAAVVWPSIERFTLVEAEPEMIAGGRALADAAPARSMSWVLGDASTVTDPADLVLASYVLGEIADDRFAATCEHLWSRADDALVLVEPGTPAGYARIIATRDAVVAAGGFTVAPCPHDRACPLASDDWCHFATRLERSASHRAVKRVSRGFEDEKFSYVALSRTPGGRAAARIVRPPLVRSGHVYLDTCEVGGIARRIVSRRDKDAYRVARKAWWGDAFEPGDSPEHS